MLEGARSVICVADRYQPPAKEIPEGAFGRVAAYARGRDYHRVMKKRLHALCDDWAGVFTGATFRACVDTAPLLERDFAQSAGLGRVGKNTMLIEPSVGSWMLLGEIVTTLEIEPTPSEQGDPCGTCTRCIDACPTDALSPWSLDAGRCVSALTIEQRTPIDSSLHAGVGMWVFGCDICQEVCPHNGATERTQAAKTHALQQDGVEFLSLIEVLQWDADARLDVIAGTAMTRATLDMWKRNACVVAGNLPAGSWPSDLHSAVIAARDEDEGSVGLREAAAQALLRHGS